MPPPQAAPRGPSGRAERAEFEASEAALELGTPRLGGQAHACMHACMHGLWHNISYHIMELQRRLLGDLARALCNRTIARARASTIAQLRMPPAPQVIAACTCTRIAM